MCLGALVCAECPEGAMGIFPGTQMCQSQLDECVCRGEGLMVHARECAHAHTHAHDLGKHRFLETQG